MAEGQTRHAGHETQAGGTTVGDQGAEGVTLSVATGRTVAELLELLAEMPSTADIVAEGARLQASRLVEHLPAHQRRVDRHQERTAPGSMSIDMETATEVVELLELFAELPSTPPLVAEDARNQAEDIARQLPAEEP